jgi:hypothetical protein
MSHLSGSDILWDVRAKFSRTLGRELGSMTEGWASPEHGFADV